MNQALERWDLQDHAALAAESASEQAHKKIVTIRIDADTLAWFKAQGPGYQTRINRLLREHMQAQLAPGQHS